MSPEKPSAFWPVMGVALLVAKKVLAVVYYLITQAEHVIKALRHYRRHFS